MTILILYIILYSFATLGILIISALVFLRHQKKEYNSFAFFALFLGLWILLQFVAQMIHEVLPNEALIALGASVALPAFFSVFFFAFTRQYVLRDINILKHLVMPIILAVTAFIPGLMIKSAKIDYIGITVEDGPLYTPLIIFILIYMIMGMKNLIVEMKNSPRESSQHHRTKLLVFGMVQQLVIVLATVILIPEELLGQLVIPITSLLLVIIFAYAIIKHRLFDIRLVVARSLAYLLALTSIGSIYTFFTFAVTSIIFDSSALTPTQQVTYVAAAALLAISFSPLKKLFDRLTDSLFFRRDYDPQETLNQLGDVAVDEIDLRRLSVKSMEILATALKPQYVSVYVLSAARELRPYRFSVGESPRRLDTVSEEKLFMSTAGKDHSEIVVADMLEDDNKELQKVMLEANAALIVRLETSRELVGHLFFGPKQNGAAYNTKDLQMLKTVGDELALATQNSLRFQEIRDFNTTLQEKVDAATIELRRTNAKLKQLDVAKDEFISMASHQLRTPLTTIKGYLSMVIEGDAGELTPMQHKLLDEAYSSSQRMVGLISDFLNVSRLKTGKFVLEPTAVFLPELVTEEIDQLSATAAARQLTVKYTPPEHFPTLKIDENKIRQVIMNFMDNAIYYSKPGSSIQIELLNTGKEVSFKVKDEGIGVPSSERPHLFTKFFRASNARKARPDGTGIGLFMAKKVIVAHGGTIIFETVEGKGSVFGFSLPVLKS